MLRLRPEGDPPGPLGQADRHRGDEECASGPEAGGMRGKATLRAGREGVTGVCEVSRRGPVSRVTRRLAEALGVDRNEGSLHLGRNGPL